MFFCVPSHCVAEFIKYTHVYLMRFQSLVRTLVPPPFPELILDWNGVEERALLHSCMHPLPLCPSPIVLCLRDSEPSSVWKGTETVQKERDC